MGKRKPTIGIDLGTSTTLLADGSSGRSVVVPIGLHERWIPSTAGRVGDRLVVGDETSRLDPESVLRSPKRYITEQAQLSLLPTPPSGVDPEEALRELLRAVIRAAEALGMDLSASDVRLGCPAMWTGVQRSTLSNLAADVGLEVRSSDLVEEPVAVGVAWILEQWRQHRDDVGGRIVVVDAGGGTTDVAVLQATDDNGQLRFSVLASDALSTAGDHIDELVGDYLRQRDGVDEQRVSDVALSLVSRQLKEDLTLEPVAKRLSIGENAVEFALTREELDALLAPTCHVLTRFVKAVTRSARLRERDALAPSAIRQEPWEHAQRDIHHVVVAGGTGQVPAIQEAVDDLFDREIVLIESPQTAVVEGLAAAQDYGRINLPRPPFDFYLDYEVGGVLHRRQLYGAFTPLYPWYAVVSPDASLNYRLEVDPDGLAPGSSVPGRVFCSSPDDLETRVPFNVYRRVETCEVHDARRQWEGPGPCPCKWAAKASDWLEVTVDSRQRFEFTLRPDGSMVVGGQVHVVREWPILRGRHKLGAGIDIARQSRWDGARDVPDDWRSK